MTTQIPTATPQQSVDLPVVPTRHYGRWAGGAVLLVLLAMLVNTLFTNPRFQWDVVGEYLTSTQILDGLITTLWLTLVAMGIGIVLGTVLAVMRMSPNRLVSGSASAYIWFFRGTPLLVQLIFWFNLSALYPRLSLGIPFGPEFVSGSANAFITVYVAACLGLGLNEGAYMSEIVRAGINSVDPGQRQAAEALGMSQRRILTKIILPQAMRVIIPPTGNQLIGMLKTTSLVSVIALPDLLYSAQLIYSSNFQTIPLLIVASIWYLIVTTVLSIGQFFVERHFSKSDNKPTLTFKDIKRIVTNSRREVSA
ncbi:amino acid ABC transporter permease [Rhodococcoides kyotonense]|uniref:Polar amino acid transport system permease protein n=1 Tax=Rhodococcoides kyotonense TaxID=398843 RepID=A0A239N8H4_9NOCA|nr:amino acid ABC transporter permease [Rhodococcus kyotonensis]SNT50782.1 polar amino acid transport system permease protein [Rhodococcus kyotonensis]